MWNHKRHFVIISVMSFLGLLLAVSAFGREYSTEPTEPSAAKPASRPPRPAPAKVSPQAKRSAVTYSTEGIAESPSETDPDATTTGARDHTVSRTRMVPGMPYRPETPNVPDVPEGDGYYNGGYQPVGGTIHIRPGPYLAGRRGVRRPFWPGLWVTDISYSWSGNSGGGEFAYCGYHYSWGDNPAASDASGCDQVPSVVESEPKTRNDYTSSGDEDIRHSDNWSIQPSDANELPPDASASEVTVQTNPKAAKDG